MDQDSTAEATIRAYPDAVLSEVRLFADTGHSKKAVQKTVTSIVGAAARFGGLSRRVGLMFMAIIKKHTVTMLEESAAAGVRTELSMDELLVRFQSRLKQDLAKLPQHYSLLDCDVSCPCLYLRDPAERAQAKASAF